MSPHWGSTPPNSGGAGERRGQTETLGYVLVFALMITGALAVVTLGATAINDTEEQLSDDRAEKALTQFDSKAGLVALEEADSQRVDFATDANEQFEVNEEDGWMRVTMENVSEDTIAEVMNITLGSVNYRNQDTVFAYQGGGVWQATENGGQMVSPPEFHYRNGTLTLPAISISGDAYLGSTAEISQGGVNQTFPNATRGEEWINPLSNHQVNVTVQSEYYRGWGQYFEERTDGEAVYHHDDNMVTLELVVEANYPPVEGGLVTGTAETLILKNNAEVDSYNSTEGPYGSSGSTEPAQSDSRIIAANDVSIENNAILHGNLEAGGEVDIDNNGEIRYGNVSHEDGFVNDGTWLTGPEHWANDNASVLTPDPVDRLIDDLLVLREDPDNNNNDDATNITSDQLQNCDPQCTLDAGQYYLDSLHLLSDENLRLNTTGGNVEVVIDGDVTLENDQEIEITGDNRANLYVDGDTTFTNGASVTVPGDNSTQFWLFMRPETVTALQNNVIYQGVVFGPGNSRQGTHVTLAQNAEVYGGVVGDVDFQANNVWIHFDEALGKIDPVEYETSTVRITYLHVTENQINVTSG